MGAGDVIRLVNDRAARVTKNVLPVLAAAEVGGRDFDFANCLLRDECQSSCVFNRASILGFVGSGLVPQEKTVRRVVPAAHQIR
jgi:hypothetical protein